MPPDSLTEIIDSLTELKRMHQLNLELLEQLAITCDWLRNSGIRLPNESTFYSLLNKTTTLLDEIQADSPKTIVYQKLSDGRKHLSESDGKVPVPQKYRLHCLQILSCLFRKGHSGSFEFFCFHERMVFFG